MHHQQRNQTHDRLRAAGIDRALFADSGSVTWLTGFAPPVQLGQNPFAGGPSLVWYEAGHFTLIVVDGLKTLATGVDEQPDCDVQSYLGYAVDQPIDGAAHLQAALQATIGRSSGLTGRVGVEVQALPAYLWALLEVTSPSGTRLVAIDHWLDPSRTIKTDEELAKLRQNFRLTGVGHEAARAAVQAGRREIDVWTVVYGAIHQAAGQRVPVGNDFIVGHRQANIGGWPLDLEIRPDDAFIVDLSTMLHGYWSDSCATYYAGEPTPRQAAMHRTVAQALELAVSLVRPGVSAREIDRQVRRFIDDAGYPVYPHHTGHGVGVSGHEAPRIVPYSDEILAAGMVIMLEPGIYYPGETGVRLEDAVLVTDDGAEILTHHDKDLP